MSENLLNSRFELLNELGKGGFSVTYLAQDHQRKQKCVVKQLCIDKIDDWKAIELFDREAGVLSHLNHPNIPNYIDHFTEADTQGQSYNYLVQEYIQGKNFEELQKPCR